MFELRDKFVPSDTPYAFQPESLRFGNGWTIRAIWVTTISGRNSVNVGRFTYHARGGAGSSLTEYLSFGEFLSRHNDLYGPDTYYKWNGERLWVNPTLPEDAQAPEMLTYVERAMHNVWTDLPNLPSKHAGWYYKIR